MPVSKVTVGSAVSVQAVKPIEAVPPVGELPTGVSASGDVPVTPTQDDKLFVRESIGSATVEKRLDLDIPDSGLTLTACRNESGVQTGLSVDRPVVLAAIDVLSRFADDATVKKSIDQNFQLAEFENELLKADYDFLMSSLKSQNPQLLQSLQDSLNSEETSLKEKLRILSEISSKSEEISRRLDFVRPENSFLTKVQEEANSVGFRFEESRPNGASFGRVINNKSTSTSVIKKIQERIKAPVFSPLEIDLIRKIRAGSTLFQDTATYNGGIRYSYNDLDGLEKTVVCCRVLSKIMAETFIRAKFPDLKNANLPISLSMVTNQSNFIFESNDVTGASDQNLFEGLSANSIETIARFRLNEFSPEKSIKNNNFESVISKIIKDTSTDSLLSRLESVRDAYSNSKSFFRFRQAVGFQNDFGSSHDIFFDIAKLTVDSFPTYARGATTDSTPNEYELLDSVLMSFGCKNKASDVNLNALWRAIILSSVTDPDYAWGEVDPEIYESRTETKSTTEVDGEVKTTKSNSGSNQKGAGKVSSTNDDKYYDPLKKRGFIPKFAEAWISTFLSLHGSNPDLASGDHNHKIFDTDFLRERGVQSQIEINGEKIVEGESSYRVERDSRVLRNANTFTFEYNDASTEALIEDRKILRNALKSLTSRNNSVVFLVTKLYDSLIEKFSNLYDVEVNDSEFVVEGRSISKTAILDLMFECVSNFVVSVVNPVLSRQLDNGCILLKGRQIDENSASIDKLLYSGVIYLVSGHESKTQLGFERSVSNNFNSYESFRLLKLLKDLTFQSVDSFFKLYFLTLDNASELFGLQVAFSAGATLSESNDSSYYLVRNSIGSQLSSIIEEYSEDILTLSILSTVVSTLDFSLTSLIRLREKIDEFKKTLSTFSEKQKNDVFKCLTLASTTSALLKNQNRDIMSTENFESDYERYTRELDISATRWFFNNRDFSYLDKSRIVFFGLPQGFTSALIRQARELDPETFEMTSRFPVPNTNPAYFESILTSRGVQDGTKIANYKLMKFHPLIHVVQKNKISVDDLLSNLSDFMKKFEIYVYDAQKGTLKLQSNFFDLLVAVNKLGLSVDAAVEIVQSHILDSIHKSVVRTLTGLQIDADTLGTYGRAMSVSDAGSVLQLMSADTAGVIPRGSMSAINFLNRTEDGFIGSIPYSRLRGLSSDKTNPSDHALLMKFLNTRAFTKGTLSREVLLPSAFERVYCGIFNPADSDLAGSPDENLNISQITINAIRSEGEIV